MDRDSQKDDAKPSKTRAPVRPPPSGGPASGPSLREDIREISQAATEALQEAGITEDADIQLLTREDLNELLPGIKNFKDRKEIFELITNSRQSGTQARDAPPNSKGVPFPADSFNDALVPGGVQSDYLPLPQLKEMRDQLVAVQFVLQQHIDLLEGHASRGTAAAPSLATVAGPSGPEPGSSDQSSSSRPPHPHDQISTVTETPSGGFLTWANPRTWLGSRDGGAGSDGGSKEKNKEKKRTAGGGDAGVVEGNKRLNSTAERKRPVVRVYFLVGGKTLDQHITLISQVTAAGVELRETSPKECQVIIVFCPITSRVGTDVGAVRTKTPGGKDVILVMMHHTFDPEYVTNQRASAEWPEVKQEVNVLFHDSEGLLRCQGNTNAVRRIYDALQRYIMLY